MRLKRLEVVGFKSFFDKTVITFRKGITGIVGPNGCGKSNFADAILWVLGEQSPKSLRGERMEDVIFSGTDQRKPLSAAEVSLTIGDIANELPPPYTPYAELTLSRRLYRSGESEYLINKTPCRLKDIRDLLIDIGAGYHAHTIIEQGKVDEIITASPLERREIVEEAAGIAKYRLRKAEALRKLEATERNLLRVTDIIGEIKRQRNALDRQAKKAEKVQEMSASLKKLELQVARHEWVEWKSNEEQLEREETDLHQQSAGFSAQIGSLTADHAAHKLSMTQQEETLRELGHQISEVEKNIQRWEGKLELVHTQREEWLETQSRTVKEMNASKEALLSLEAERGVLDEEIAEITRTLPEAEAALSIDEGKTRQLEEILLSVNTDLERCKVSLFDLSSQLSTAKNNLVHYEVRKESLYKQKERLRLEMGTLDEKRERSALLLKQAEAVYQKNTELLAGLRIEQTAYTERLKQAEALLRVKQNQLREVQEASVKVKAQAASHEGFYRGFLSRREGAENLLLRLSGLQGMVADLMDVPPRYELALESVLENKLRGIVVENHGEIQKGIRHLREMEMGRGTFFPRILRTPKNEGAGPAVNEPGEGIIGCALDLVSVQPGYESIAEALLGGIVLMTDLEAALKAWQIYPMVATWVTLQGEVLDRSGAVSGGEQGKASLLAEKRVLQQLTDQADKLQKETESLQHEIQANQEIAETVRQEIVSLSEKIRLLDVEQLKGQNEQKTLLFEVRRLEGERETILFEQEEGASEEEKLKASEEAAHRLIAEAFRVKVEKEALLETLKQTLGEHRKKLSELSETVVMLRMKSNSLKEKQRHTLEKLGRVNREKAHLSSRLNEMTTRESALQEKLTLGRAEEEEAVSSVETLAEELSRYSETLRQARESHALLLSALQKEEKEISSLRSSGSQVEKTLQEKALKKVSVSMNRQKIEETILSRYQIEISQVLADPDDPLLDRAREEVAQLREKIEGVGPVNLAAIEEYKELDTRFQFLSGQEEDLIQSMESLREAISKINKTTRGLFVETFNTLNQKFAEVFTSFFGGGSAELVLLDEANPLESGIEMMAQPPGKGKRSILLFSGGEKALTAISLLFATFLIHPTPFCLLDEIDAPLDEENTRRFSQALVKMSDQTQFIVVTHNKFTMEIADVLYGVTMEETGISKLVSVNLNTPTAEASETTSVSAQ